MKLFTKHLAFIDVAYETINLHKYMVEKWQGNTKEAKGLLIWVNLNRFNVK